MEFGNQHVVPVSYLKAWVDPLTPDGYEPYVWMISKDGSTYENRAPQNILAESDFYTVLDERGNRDVELEKRLSKIESDFVRIRDSKVGKRLPLDKDDRVALINFVSTAFSRTNLHKESQSELWEDYQRELAYLPAGVLKDKLVEKAKSLAAQPMPYFMFHFLEAVLPTMARMNVGIYSTNQIPGFFTSDNPVLWPEVLNPETHTSSGFFGIDSPSLEIIMPISPGQVLIFSKQNPAGYFDVENNFGFVEAINQMTVGFAETVFVSCSSP